MGKLIAFCFVIFGIAMSILCFVYGGRKVINGELDFRTIKILKSINEFKGSISDFSGLEILAVGILLLIATGLFYFFVFLRA